MEIFTGYIHNKPFIICDTLDDVIRKRMTDEQLEYFSNPAPADLSLLLKKAGDKETHGCVLESGKAAHLRDHLLGQFDIWDAGGGLVVNPAQEILLMFRRGFWDLPKGKLDKGETIEACALREVSEETGLHHLRLRENICETWHSYRLDGKAIMKHTVWFRMEFTGNELTVPQIEEDIMDIQWVRPKNVGKYLRYSYPNIREVFLAAGYGV